MSNDDQIKVNFRQLLAFFVPLGFSASLVTISHVIINSTLAHSADPEIIIASYALPLSIMNIAEKPALLLRQTGSVLVRDHQSFRAMSLLTLYVLGSIFLMDILISYTPVGQIFFSHLFGADDRMVNPMLQVYRLLMFVTIFSGIRCVFQGIIIFNMHTKWLTIGMLMRLFGMYILSLLFVQTESVTSGNVGAIIFLTGMIIEAIFSFWEGKKLLKTVIPKKKPDYSIHSPGQFFRFYRPLLFSSIIAVITEPSIISFLGKTPGIQVSIASFVIAASLTELVQSFFSYVHQIVINFYKLDAVAIKRFVLIISPIPSLLIAIMTYSPVGPWFMKHIIGINEQLMQNSLSTLRIFMIMTFIFPWLDFCNGFLMLHNQTKVFIWSQAANLCTVLLTLILCISFVPHWNSKIGALAQSLGVLAETAIVLFTIRKLEKMQFNLKRDSKV